MEADVPGGPLGPVGVRCLDLQHSPMTRFLRTPPFGEGQPHETATSNYDHREVLGVDSHRRRYPRPKLVDALDLCPFKMAAVLPDRWRETRVMGRRGRPWVGFLIEIWCSRPTCARQTPLWGSAFEYMSTDPIVRIPDWPPARLAVRVTRLDLRPASPLPTLLRTGVGIVVGVLLSLGVNWLIVRVATTLAPSLASFPHFQLHDYGRLTVIGSLIACAGWPILTRLSSSPGWIYGWVALLGTLVLWLPDLYIWAVLHEPAPEVLVLAAMHVAVVLVSCASMVLIAARPRDAARLPA